MARGGRLHARTATARSTSAGATLAAIDALQARRAARGVREHAAGRARQRLADADPPRRARRARRRRRDPRRRGPARRRPSPTGRRWPAPPAPCTSLAARRLLARPGPTRRPPSTRPSGRSGRLVAGGAARAPPSRPSWPGRAGRAAATSPTRSGRPGTRSPAPRRTKRPSSARSASATTPTPPRPSPGAWPGSAGASTASRPPGCLAMRGRDVAGPLVDRLLADGRLADLDDEPAARRLGAAGGARRPRRRDGPGAARSG